MKYTIEQARKLKGITQRDMAKRLNMSESTYIKYEKYENVLRIDKAYAFSFITNIPEENIIFFKEKLQKICS